ncbi:MAG: methyl-accepting chemotaxis protein [Candidatus Omnitrophica bacterium]|nr:methyl-accepting chemotaxis protein [Candidatus Omnitrophota bacterium]
MKNTFGSSIKTKLVTFFLLISLLPLVVVGTISYFASRRALENEFLKKADAISSAKEEAITRYLRTKEKVTKGFASDFFVRNTLEKIVAGGVGNQRLDDELSNYIKVDKEPVDPDIENTFVLNMEGKIVASTDKSAIGQDKSQDLYFIHGKVGTYIKDAYVSSTGKDSIAVAVPVRSKTSGKTIGVLANRYTTTELNKILGDHTGMGNTGETYIVNRDGFMITDSRFLKDTFLKQKVETEPVRLFQGQKKVMIGLYSDYNGNLVLGASNGDILDKEFGLGWTILGETDADEAFAPVVQLRNIMLLVILLVVVLVVILASFISDTIANPIKQLSTNANEVAKGDLTAVISVKGNDEIGLLAGSFKDMVTGLKLVLTKIQDATTQITSASSEILASSQQQASGAREQSSAVAETTSAAKELSLTSEQVGDSIKRVSVAATHALAGMAKIKEAVAKTSNMITSLGEKSQQIGKITELIDDVADQTNLLAVNASIEAARAGEQGRGFTVVADEIRKLADSSAKSTKDITALIEIIQHEMSNSVMAMETSVISIDEEAKLASETADSAKEIAMSTTQQISGSKQIADAMGNIDEAMKQIAAGAAQSQAAVKQLTGLAKELKDTVEKFKIN